MHSLSFTRLCCPVIRAGRMGAWFSFRLPPNLKADTTRLCDLPQRGRAGAHRPRYASPFESAMYRGSQTRYSTCSGKLKPHCVWPRATSSRHPMWSPLRSVATGCAKSDYAATDLQQIETQLTQGPGREMSSPYIKHEDTPRAPLQPPPY